MSFRPLGAEATDPLVARAIVNQFNNGSKLSNEEIEKFRKTIKFPEFLAPHKPEEEGKYNNFKNVDGAKNDKGHLGSPSFKNLFPAGAKYKTEDLSPNFGTEIDGIQLSQLDDAGKNDLALYLETRGLAVFRNQDFREKGPAFAKKFGEYFGPLHIHPVSFAAEDHPELLITFRPPGDEERYKKQFFGKTKGFAWHSDVSFEEYPASFSFFVALEAPSSGGDTVFLDFREAYRRLSPTLQKFFETLTVIHTNFYQNTLAQLNGNTARVKGDYFTEHPLVRTHPVTGEKSLFFSRAFIHSIKGLKSEESAALLTFLEDHVTNNPELQVRATHKGTDAATVIAWDNRILSHTAIADFLQHKTGPRHHFRITVIGEKPYFDNGEKKHEKEAEKTNGNLAAHGNGNSNGNGKSSESKTHPIAETS